MKSKRITGQQYHRNVKAARAQIAKWRRDYRSSWSQDYGDYRVVSIKLAKKDPYGGPNVKVHGRRLYDIVLEKKRKRRKGRR